LLHRNLLGIDNLLTCGCLEAGKNMIVNSPKTERLGISALEKFFSSIGWLFREQQIHDYGIDAHVEIVEDNFPNGQLIALQVKTGQSYLSEGDGKFIVHRITDKHYRYWKNHCLPVVVVLYDEVLDKMYWQEISSESIRKAGKNWKLLVPSDRTLGNESMEELVSLSKIPIYYQKLNRLILDKKWIELIYDGEDVCIEFEDWINKSLSRFEIKIKCTSRNDVGDQSWPMLFGVGWSISDVISYVIPWAKFEVNEDEYKDYLEPIWDAECYMGYDKEDDIAIYTQSFEDWYTPPDGIVPVFGDGAEVEGYRLYLSLNELGKSFLILNNYLELGDCLLCTSK
jgi:hypothetical protein